MIKAHITLEVEGDMTCPRAEDAATLAGRSGNCSSKWNLLLLLSSHLKKS